MFIYIYKPNYKYISQVMDYIWWW